jgi:hypothetical protein
VRTKIKQGRERIHELSGLAPPTTPRQPRRTGPTTSGANFAPICACSHLTANMIMFSPLLSAGFDRDERLLVAGIELVASILLSNYRLDAGWKVCKIGA